MCNLHNILTGIIFANKQTHIMLKNKIIEIFIKVDDFCNYFEKEYKKHQIEDESGIKHRNKKLGFVVLK